MLHFAVQPRANRFLDDRIWNDGNIRKWTAIARFNILIIFLSYSCFQNFVQPSTNISQIIQTKFISVSLVGDGAAATASAPVRVVQAPPPPKPRQGPVTTLAELYCGICEVYGSSPQNILDHVNG